MKVHQVVLMDKHLLIYRLLSCFCQNSKGKCECYNPKTHKFDIKAKPEIESEETDYELQLNEETGVIRIVRKQIDKSEENERIDLENEDMLLNFIEKEEVYNNVELNDSLVEFAEKKLQRLCGNTNDEKYLKRKHNGHVIELKRNKKNQCYNRDSSDESCDDYSTHDSSSDLENFEDETPLEADYLDPEIEMCSDNNAAMEIIKDSHVVVRFELEKRNKYFLGQVLQLVGNVTFEVKFLIKGMGGLPGQSLMTCRS
ncbi:unnamed protein product [Colias eurytheme]|nr:unnamed protein product [Colias eurytheme]